MHTDRWTEIDGQNQLKRQRHSGEDRYIDGQTQIDKDRQTENRQIDKDRWIKIDR